MKSLSSDMWVFTGNNIDANATFSVGGYVGTDLRLSTGPMTGWTGNLTLPPNHPVGCYDLTVTNPNGDSDTLYSVACVTNNF